MEKIIYAPKNKISKTLIRLAGLGIFGIVLILAFFVQMVAKLKK